MYVFLKGKMEFLEGVQGSVASVLGNTSRSNLVWKDAQVSQCALLCDLQSSGEEF